MLQVAIEIILPYLHKLFNLIYDHSTFPKSWAHSMIVPIHKKGDINPDNYRPISLISILSKVFTQIINIRLTRWENLHHFIVEEQAGFRRNYSTCDNIFILYHSIRKYFHRKRKLYVAFFDYQKAFDTLDRQLLWKVPHQYSVKDKVAKIVKSIHSSARSCVKCKGYAHRLFPMSKWSKTGVPNEPRFVFIHD